MFGWLKSLFTPKKEPQEGRMYDLRERYWGHSIKFNGNGKLPNSHSVYGFLTPSASNGDTFLFPATNGLAVWALLEVDNCDDPRDMFFAEAGVIRYATEDDLMKVEGLRFV